MEQNKAAEEQKNVEENKGTGKETTAHDNKAEKEEEESVQAKTIEKALEKEKVAKSGEQAKDSGVELKRNPDGTICEDCR